jgi:hypothetical protein
MSAQPESFIKSRIKAFRYAITGWWFVIRTQRNAWIHMVVSIAVIILSFILHISASSWALILLAIALVWIAEFLNTPWKPLLIWPLTISSMSLPGSERMSVPRLFSLLPSSAS